MEDVKGGDNNLGLVDGPFGFGYGITLVSQLQQCQVKRNYPDRKDCTHDPSNCSQGLSISIWENKSFTLEEFHDVGRYNHYPKAYLFSTGGDTVGHPGVALYHQGAHLVGLVSTGHRYWLAHAAGAIANNTWNNVGLRWDEQTGLEVLVNDRIVSYQMQGKDSTRKGALDPPEIMVGCHKDADMDEYGHYLTASLDELAIWHRRLVDNNTIYFLGGYEGEVENIEMSEYEKMLNKTDLKDKMQHAVAMAILLEMTKPTSDLDQGPANTTEDQEAAAEANKTELFHSTVRLYNRLAQPENIPTCTRKEDINRLQMMTTLTSNMMSSDKANYWVHSESQGDLGVLGLPQVLDDYLGALAHSLHCNNDSRLSFSATTPHLYVQMNKLPTNEFRSMERYVVPSYSRPSELQNTWGDPSQRIEVPTNLFSDSRCQTRKVNIVTTLYENLDDSLQKPVKVNPKTLNAKVDNLLDSQVASLGVLSDQERMPSGDMDPRLPLCSPDPAKLKLNAIKFKLKHKDQRVALRKLLFHENEVETDVNTRHCVWWNIKAGPHGAWDRRGCRVVETSTHYTKCACRTFGMYALLAEKVEPKEVAEEAGWLRTTKYILYGLSAFCLLIYITVVAIAGVLKEQFHLLGLSLAVLLLGGSLCMVLTDLDTVRQGRHLCTALGTLLHLLYLCAGACVAMLGHATFKCITAGIIGGNLRQYGYLSVGATLVSVGCTYTFYMHDLGTDPRCFISWDNGPKLFFFGPQLLCCGAGLFCAVVIFFNLRTAALRNNPAMIDYQSFSLGAALLTLYFSVTWTVGGVTYLRSDIEIDLYPFFQLLNSLMGVVLLACVGAGSSRFRMFVAGQAKRRRQMFLNHTRGGVSDDLDHAHHDEDHAHHDVDPAHHDLDHAHHETDHAHQQGGPAHISPATAISTQPPISPDVGRPGSSSSLFSY